MKKKKDDFTLIFKFKQNDYFENEILKKAFHFENDEE